MIAVDTNVLVRLLTNDDPQQGARAARLFASDNVLIPKSVLLETEWVLRFSYGLARTAIVAAFQRLLSLDSVTLEGAPAVRAALRDYAAGMDFGDALHVRSSEGADTFFTFDRKLVRAAARGKTAPPVRQA